MDLQLGHELPKRPLVEVFMGGRHDQVSRIYEVLDQLHVNPHGLTITELHQRIGVRAGVDRRTISRDIEALEQAGFPLVAEVDADDQRVVRWKLNGKMKIAKSIVLSPRELVALYLARASLAPLRDTPFYEDLEAAFARIEGALGAKSVEYLAEIAGSVHFEPGPRWGLGIEPNVIETVRACCDEGHVMSVEYRSRNSGDCRRRTLGPQFIYFAQGSVYLVAEDLEVGKVKVFSLPRMRDPRMSSEEYAGSRVDPEEFFASAFSIFQGGAVQEIKLIFQPHIADYVRERRWHPSQRIVPLSDGRLRVTLNVALSSELQNWILGFGADVLVEGPGELRQSLVQAAEAILRIYPRKVA